MVDYKARALMPTMAVNNRFPFIAVFTLRRKNKIKSASLTVNVILPCIDMCQNQRE